MRALVIKVEAERIDAVPVSDGKTDNVIRIDEIIGRGAQVELGEYGALDVQLQAVSLAKPQESIQAQGLPNAH